VAAMIAFCGAGFHLRQSSKATLCCIATTLIQALSLSLVRVCAMIDSIDEQHTHHPAKRYAADSTLLA
jgi:hypothetical protein